MHSLFAALLAFTCLPLAAQIGGPYPDPTEGPGRRFPAPQTTPSGIPWPRGKKGTNPDKDERLKTTAGKLRAVSEKTITIDTDDGRVMEFNRGPKTRVFEQEKERKVSELKPGDLVSVDATEDNDGYFYARDIRITGHAAPPPPIEASAEKKGDKKQDEAAGRSPIPAVMTLPPVVGDTDDDETPRLRRGIHPRPKEKDDEEEPQQQQQQVAVIPPHTSAPVSARAESRVPSAEDPNITKAREASAAFTAKLPNYVCTEYMTRYQSDTRPVDWQPLDVVSTELVYQDGKEDYRKVAINGKQTKKAISEIGGSWSTGEFATTLVDLFSPASQASFFFRSESMVAGTTTRVYDFRVEKANSHWHIQVAGQWILPAYKGSVWVEPKTGRVLRIEMQTAFLPDEFPLDQVESAVDYEAVRLGERKYLLPVHAENLACQRFSRTCSRSAIDFRNYHVFGSDSNIKFDSAAR